MPISARRTGASPPLNRCRYALFGGMCDMATYRVIGASCVRDGRVRAAKNPVTIHSRSRGSVGPVNQEPPHVGYAILVSDQLPALRHFYTELLGLDVIEERPDYIKLDAGSIFLALRQPNRSYDRPAVRGFVQLAFPTDKAGIDQWAHSLEEAGVEILEPPTNQPWGHRTLFAADPDGNLIEFYTEIPSAKLRRGR